MSQGIQCLGSIVPLVMFDFQVPKKSHQLFPPPLLILPHHLHPLQLIPLPHHSFCKKNLSTKVHGMKCQKVQGVSNMESLALKGIEEKNVLFSIVGI